MPSSFTVSPRPVLFISMVCAADASTASFALFDTEVAYIRVPGPKSSLNAW